MNLVTLAKIASPYIPEEHRETWEKGAENVQDGAKRVHGVFKQTFNGSPQREMAAVGGTLVLMKVFKMKPSATAGSLFMAIAYMNSTEKKEQREKKEK